MDEDIIAILIEKQELENDYTPKRKEMSFLHHQSSPNSTLLRTRTHAHLWMSWDGAKTLVVVNRSWKMAVQFKLTNFGPITSTCGCSFIVWPLKISSFDNFSYHMSLFYPLDTWYILLFLKQQSLGAVAEPLTRLWALLPAQVFLKGIATICPY